jgi:NitT/TauT family transport system permease protein
MSAIAMAASPSSLAGGAGAPRRHAPGGVLALCALLAIALSAAMPLLADAPTALLLDVARQQRALAALGLMLLLTVRLLWPSGRWMTYGLTLLALSAGLLWLGVPPALGDVQAGSGFWLGCVALGLIGLLTVHRCAHLDGSRLDAQSAAAVLGLWALLFWQLGVTAFDVPRVILPAPQWVLASLVERAGTLAQDAMQTLVREALAGWLIGCGLGFGVALAIDRHSFLQRGLLPIASMTSAVPLVGVAPIAVMWFGFGWESKAAVVALMTFFPMLVSTLAGLRAAGKLEAELMQTYGASHRQTLWLLKLPSAVPQMITALKINATLALIGAIVAEFFGSPTVGLGFRISTEAARMNMGLVWAAITVASVAGSAAYAALVLLERRAAFWHPSVRSAA